MSVRDFPLRANSRPARTSSRTRLPLLHGTITTLFSNVISRSPAAALTRTRKPF